MKITTITYRRVKNLGNYESEALEATANLEDWEITESAYKQLLTWVHHQLDIPKAEPDIDPDINEVEF